MTTCLNCGAAATTGATVCAKCGAAILASSWYITFSPDGSDSELRADRSEYRQVLRKAITEATISAATKITTHSVDKEGKWSSLETTLSEFCLADSSSLRMHFQPLLAAALVGLKWAIVLGIVLSLFNTQRNIADLDYRVSNAMLYVNLAIGAAVIIFAFLPSLRWLVIVALVAGFVQASKMRNIENLLAIAVGSTAAGALLVGPLGIAIGGAYGWLRRSKIPLAKGVLPEPSSSLLKLILLPALIGVGMWVFYVFYFTPWAAEALSKTS